MLKAIELLYALGALDDDARLTCRSGRAWRSCPLRRSWGRRRGERQTRVRVRRCSPSRRTCRRRTSGSPRAACSARWTRRATADDRRRGRRAITFLNVRRAAGAGGGAGAARGGAFAEKNMFGDAARGARASDIRERLAKADSEPSVLRKSGTRALMGTRRAMAAGFFANAATWRRTIARIGRCARARASRRGVRHCTCNPGNEFRARPERARPEPAVRKGVHVRRTIGDPERRRRWRATSRTPAKSVLLRVVGRRRLLRGRISRGAQQTRRLLVSRRCDANEDRIERVKRDDARRRGAFTKKTSRPVRLSHRLPFGYGERFFLGKRALASWRSLGHGYPTRSDAVPPRRAEASARAAPSRGRAAPPPRTARTSPPHALHGRGDPRRTRRRRSRVVALARAPFLRATPPRRRRPRRRPRAAPPSPPPLARAQAAEPPSASPAPTVAPPPSPARPPRPPGRTPPRWRPRRRPRRRLEPWWRLGPPRRAPSQGPVYARGRHQPRRPPRAGARRSAPAHHRSGPWCSLRESSPCRCFRDDAGRAECASSISGAVAGGGMARSQSRDERSAARTRRGTDADATWRCARARQQARSARAAGRRSRRRRRRPESTADARVG